MTPDEIANAILDARPEMVERWAKGWINPVGTVRK